MAYRRKASYAKRKRAPSKARARAHRKTYGKSLRRDFRRTVNMTPRQLRAWLTSPESKSVGFTYPGRRESVGHASGRKIVRMLTGDKFDETHARKVVGYVRRHLAQRPAGDVSATRWRYSLMNWGHDPLRSDKV